MTLEDIKPWLPLLAMLISFAGSWAITQRQVPANTKAIERHETRLNIQDTEIALLKQEQRAHGSQIRELVRELREAVSNLQRVAIDLAEITGSKRGH